LIDWKKKSFRLTDDLLQIKGVAVMQFIFEVLTDVSIAPSLMLIYQRKKHFEFFMVNSFFLSPSSLLLLFFPLSPSSLLLLFFPADSE
jgi:hypothetical protein